MKIWIESNNVIFQNSGISQWIHGILFGIAEKDKDRAISIIKNNALLKQIDATNNAQLTPFITHFANELNLLQVKTAALRSEKENQRIIELQQYIDTMLFNASQKAGIDLNLVNKEAIQRLEFNADGTPKVK